VEQPEDGGKGKGQLVGTGLGLQGEGDKCLQAAWEEVCELRNAPRMLNLLNRLNRLKPRKPTDSALISAVAAVCSEGVLRNGLAAFHGVSLETAERAGFVMESGRSVGGASGSLQEVLVWLQRVMDLLWPMMGLLWGVMMLLAWVMLV